MIDNFQGLQGIPRTLSRLPWMAASGSLRQAPEPFSNVVPIGSIFSCTANIHKYVLFPLFGD
jgi:hypothetical protein